MTKCVSVCTDSSNAKSKAPDYTSKYADNSSALSLKNGSKNDRNDVREGVCVGIKSSCRASLQCNDSWHSRNLMKWY